MTRPHQPQDTTRQAGPHHKAKTGCGSRPEPDAEPDTPSDNNHDSLPLTMTAPLLYSFARASSSLAATSKPAATRSSVSIVTLNSPRSTAP